MRVTGPPHLLLSRSPAFLNILSPSQNMCYLSLMSVPWERWGIKGPTRLESTHRMGMRC